MIIPQEFFESLGQYVYTYIDPDTKKHLYVGKGNGNRVISHIKSKNYSLDNCYIVARNLERFENKLDWQSFLLESYLISNHQPSDNSVSGHYEECFIMAKFSELFDTYTSGLYDNFETLPSWYVENYDKIKNRIGTLTIKSDVSYFESITRNQMQMSWYYYAQAENKPFTVKFSIWAKDEKFDERKNQLIVFLESEGYSVENLNPVGVRGAFELNVNSVETAIDLLDKFMS